LWVIINLLIGAIMQDLDKWLNYDLEKANVDKCFQLLNESYFNSDESMHKEIEFESLTSFIEQYRDVDEPKSKLQQAGMLFNSQLCSKARTKTKFWNSVSDQLGYIWKRLRELRVTCTDQGVTCEIPKSILLHYEQQITIAEENSRFWELHETNFRKIFVLTFGTEPFMYGNQNIAQLDKRPITDKEYEESEKYTLKLAKNRAERQENQPQSKVVTADEQKELSHQDKKEIKSKTG
jgi:hypothetical protein